MKWLYRPNVEELQAESLPLLPGLGETLESSVEYPEVVAKYARQDGRGIWKIDSSLVASAYNPGNSLQTCFAKVEKHLSDKTLVDYYQLEYYQIPERLKEQIASLEGSGTTWVVTEVNNVQMRDWLAANGVLRHSEEIFNEVLHNRSITYRDVTPAVDTSQMDQDRDTDNDAAA